VCGASQPERLRRGVPASRHSFRTLDWTTAYVIPLRDDTPVRDVRRIEGRIGLAVWPERNKALPRVTVSR
jgi:hypothetical protein